MARSRGAQRGMTLIWAATACMFVAGVIFASVDRIKALDEISSAGFSAEAQARSVAHAGLVDAFAWFRRQTEQPVTQFAPRLDLQADPPINETDDASVGLVRTFEISPGIWGRYTVRAGNESEEFVDSNSNGYFDLGEAFEDADGDERWTSAKGTRDVTSERGQVGGGTSWYLEALGVVFARPRADLPLGSGPNRAIGSARLATEVRRLTIAPPASVAVCSEEADDVTVRERARIRADGAAIATSADTGSIVITSGAEVLAPMTAVAVPEYRDDVKSVFGVDWAQLKSMADVSTSVSQGGLPERIPEFSLVVVEGDLEYGPKSPLRGMGVLAIRGDLVIESGSNSFFNGLLYVEGNVTIRAPAYIRGTIIARGKVLLEGIGGDYVEIEHEPEVVSKLLTVMGQYRYTKAPYEPVARTPDGRPDDTLLSAQRHGGVSSTIPTVVD